MPINNLEIKPHFMAVELRKKWTFSQTSHFRNSFDVTLSHVCSTFIHLLLHLKDYFISDLKLSRRQSSLSKKKKKRQERRIDAYMLNIFSCVRFFATPWTVTHQAPLSMRFSMNPRMLDWVAMPFSRDSTCIYNFSCIGRQVLCH